MRLVRLWSEPPQIDPVEFKTGLNVIVAHKSVGADDKDTTNNLGKSTFAKVIDFCLLADTKSVPFVKHPKLAHLTFYLEFVSLDQTYVIARSFSDPEKVTLSYPDGSVHTYSVKELRNRFTDLFLDSVTGDKSHPSFRQVMNYVIRDEKEGYFEPFDSFRRMPVMDRNILTLYLMGLDFTLPKKLDTVQKEKTKLEQVRASFVSTLERAGFTSKIALLSQRSEVEQELRLREGELKKFRVHPEYRNLQTEVDHLARAMAELRNKSFVEERRLQKYLELLEANQPVVDLDAVTHLYEELNLRFPELLRKSLNDVLRFQHGVAESERRFVEKEIAGLKDRISDRAATLEDLDRRRAKITQSLAEHGALDEYQVLAGLLSNLRERAASLDAYKEMYEQLEETTEILTKLILEEEQLKHQARETLQDGEARTTQISMLFSEAYRSLYESRAYVSVDFRKAFSFGLVAENTNEFRGQGKGHASVFCYDLALLQANSQRAPFPHCILHDGVFTGVDPRQVRQALLYVCQKLNGTELQYICTLNSSKLEDVGEFAPFTRANFYDNGVEGKFLKIEF